jgi:hypothetical protein
MNDTSNRFYVQCVKKLGPKRFSPNALLERFILHVVICKPSLYILYLFHMKHCMDSNLRISKHICSFPEYNRPCLQYRKTHTVPDVANDSDIPVMLPEK